MNFGFDEGTIDPSRWRELSRGLLDGDIIWVPIRHHSPACARHTKALIVERRPYAVLIEAPRDFDEFIPLLLHPDAVFPLAIYEHATIDMCGRQTHVGSYFPFCDYSPELVALRAAADVGAHTRCIDADLRSLGPVEDDRVNDAVRHDEHFGFSAAIRVAAARAGCRDHNDLWDQLFETTDRSTPDFMAAVNAFGLLARSSANAEDLARDGTYTREAIMAREVRKTRTERDAAGVNDPIVVVTGAFHTQALRDQLAGRDQRDVLADGEDIAAPHDVVERGAHLIRYSYERLDSLNGYRSGMPAPSWYQRLFELGTEPTPQQLFALVIDVLSEIASLLRERGQTDATSMPAMIGALHQARGLSLLRGRQRPGRTDIIDAAVSCFVQGAIETEGIPVLAAVQRVMTGERIGAVPPGTARPPMAEDFDDQCRHLGLPIETGRPTRVQLDVYSLPADRAKSCFLHRVTYLGIPYAVWTSGPRFGSGNHGLQETWTCQFMPSTDAGIAEASRFGDSIERAAASRFIAETAALRDGEPAVGRVVAHLVQGIKLGVELALDAVVAHLRRHLALDPDLQSVASGLSQLLLLHSTSALVDTRQIESLPDLITQLYLRACYLVNVLSEGAGPEVEPVARAMLELRDATVVGSDMCDPNLYWNELERFGDRRAAPLLSGVTTGLLWAAQRRGDNDVVERVRGCVDGGLDARSVDEFLRGLFLAAKEVIWQIEGVTQGLTQALVEWDDDEFLARLPGLRSAFSLLTPRETDRVAELIGGVSAPTISSVDQSVLLANLERDAVIVNLLTGDGVTGLEPR